MSYVQDNLMPNEKVLFRARISRAIFLPSIIIILGSLIFFILTFSMASQQNSTGSVVTGGVLCFAVLFLLISILYAIQAFIIRGTTEFAVTNRRVIAKTGFIRRHTIEMLLTKIESVAVNQRILGSVLNYGAVTVTGTGGTKESFTAIADPMAVKITINQIIEQTAQANSQQPGATNTGGSNI